MFSSGSFSFGMFAFGPLAAVEDWLKFVIPLVFLVIYAINHLITAARSAGMPKNNNPPRRKPEPVERSLRPPPQQPQQPRASQGQLNAEIEQFLKRAGERRGGRQERDTAAKSPTKPPPKPPRERLVQAQSVAGRDLSDVATSVEEHLGHRGFLQRAEHLADDIVRADQQMEEHLHKAFDHKVGTFGDPAIQGSTPVTDDEPVTRTDKTAAAVALAALLSDPQNLKQMIVLNEILKRPNDDR